MPVRAGDELKLKRAKARKNASVLKMLKKTILQALACSCFSMSLQNILKHFV